MAYLGHSWWQAQTSSSATTNWSRPLLNALTITPLIEMPAPAPALWTPRPYASRTQLHRLTWRLSNTASYMSFWSIPATAASSCSLPPPRTCRSARKASVEPSMDLMCTYSSRVGAGPLATSSQWLRVGPSNYLSTADDDILGLGFTSVTG